ncbi:MAG: HAD-IA family hydrolase [Candidatus Krumholzibacteriia bacterium]
MQRDGRPIRRVGAFIFDLDGTLVDSGADIALSANHMRAGLGLPELPLPVVLGFVGDGAPLLVRRLLAHPARPGEAPPAVADETVRRGVALFQNHYARHCLDATVLYPGVRETLAAFAALPLAVATNKPAAFTRTILAGLGIAGCFRRIVTADDVPRRKPDPGHLAACLDGLAVAPADVVVVGDSPNDILAARGLGAVAVGATYGLTPPALVRAAAPDLLIDRFDRLTALFAPGGGGGP